MENSSAPDRIRSLDGFRGAAILLMAAGDLLAGVHWVPDALKHAPDPGFSLADLVAPMFLVAIGFTAGRSLERRTAAMGRGPALARLAVRDLALIGIGAIFSAGQAIAGTDNGTDPVWGVLQALGAASLLILPLLLLPAWARVLASAGLFALFQVLSDRLFLGAIVSQLHNGLVGVLSWAAMLLLATAAADLYFQLSSYAARAGWLLGAGAAAGLLGGLLHGWIPVSKMRASPTYMLVGLGVSLFVLGLFHLVQEARPAWFPRLRAVGRNPLALYVAHLLLLGLLRIPPWDAWYAGAPAWLTVLQAAALVAAILGLAALLERKGLALKL